MSAAAEANEIGANSVGMQWMGEEEGDADMPASAKVRVVEKTGSKEMLENELNQLKATASLLQRMRLCMSVCFFTVLVPLEFAATALAAAKSHANKTKGVSMHKLGPPHPHVWRAVLMQILAATQANTEQAAVQAKNIVQDYMDQYLKDPAKHLFFVRQARVKELKQGKALISWQLSSLLDVPAQIDRALICLFETVEGDIRTGTAPPCTLERANQKRLEEVIKLLEKMNGKK